jgi:non-specific serine/threonine protein kinase
MTVQGKFEQTPIYVYLLGRFKIELDGKLLRLPSRKDEALLVYLVLHPGQHNRDSIATLFWSDGSSQQARASLRNALAVLRRTLGAALVMTDREHVQINPDYPLQVDALEFRKQVHQFQSAALPDVTGLQLELYRGDLLIDFSDEWLIPIRETYRQLFGRALLQLGEQQRSLGHYDSAIALMRRLLELEPADEQAHQIVMACYFALGDRPAALRQFEILQRILRDELQAEPQRETLLLYQRIRNAALTPLSNHTVPGNLPTPLTGFVGRGQEIQDLEALICEQSRLVTLTGTGGSGKTRLAIEVAAACSPAFKDGIWWVDLAPQADANFVPHSIARALGIREISSGGIIDDLILRLRPKQLLVILDNCEHQIEACAQIVARLLTGCSQLRVLATSREPLRIDGETVWMVLPLSLPDTRAPLTLTVAQQAEAVQLFVKRAMAAQRSFHLTEQNIRPIVEICRQLDGIPLALELAAVCLRTLSPDELVVRLQDRFALLTGGSRSAIPRQQTLQAALDWSYELLESDEQTLFCQLSVFAGNFSLEAIESVCHLSSSPVTDLLFRLVNKSLVIFEDESYRMLETVRQYARAKLEMRDDFTLVSYRHLGWCLDLAEQAELRFSSSEQVYWLERLEVENANLRAALSWALQDDVLESGLRLVSALWWFWSRRGYLAEIRHLLNVFLSQAKRSDGLLSGTVAKALSRAGAAATRQGDYETARLFLDESLALLHILNDKSGCAFVYHQLGWLHHALKQFSLARALYQDSLSITAELGEQAQAQHADTLAYLGMLDYFEKRYPEARLHLKQSLELRQSLGEVWGPAFAEWNLGNVALGEGDYLTAKLLYQKVIRAVRSLRDRWGLPSILEGIAYAIEKAGNPEPIVTLLSTAAVIREQTVSPVPPVFKDGYDRTLAAVRVHLGEERFQQLWQAGQSMSIEDVIDLALNI